MALTLLTVCALGVYFYCINQTVRNVVERKELSRDLATMQTEIGNLEFRYIDARNDIDRSSAYQLGFRDADRSSYVTRPALGQRADRDGRL